MAVQCALLASMLGHGGCSDDFVNAANEGTASAGAAGAMGMAAGTAGMPSGIAGNAAGGGTVVEVDPAARYFEPNHVVEVAIELPTADWDALRTETRSLNDIIFGSDCQSAPFPDPFTWKRADVTIDGTKRSSVGLRKKGFLGSLDEQRPSLKISIDEFAAQDLFGVTDFTLNNVKQDPAVISQCLGYHVFTEAGLPAPRCNFAHVTVNARDLGIYAHVEPVKKPFLRRHFATDAGDLYEGTLSDFREGWLGTFEPKTSATDVNKAVLQRIADAAAAPAEQRVARLGSVLDLDAFAAFWATETLVAHVDGYSRNTNNFYVYRDPTDGLATLMPWGADMLFGVSDSSASSDDPIGKYTEGVLVSSLYSSTDGRGLLLRALQSALDRAWDEAALVAEAKRMGALVVPRLNAQQTGSFPTALLDLQTFVNGRRAVLTKAIANPPASPQPLRGPACLLPIGSVTGKFATTWGTTGAADPFATGTGALDVTLNGTPSVNRAGYIGAVAGLNPDSTAQQAAQVVVPALREDGKISLMAFGFDLDVAKPGTLKLDLARVPGVLLQLDPAQPNVPAVVGVLVGGSLVFDKIGLTTGDPVQGSFSGTLYSTPFLNGF